MRHATRQNVLFEGVFRKAVKVEFDGPSQSSDGGVLLLAAVDRELGLTEALADELRDQRDWRKVRHDHLEILRQRVYSIALGYADCNDSARIGGDPALKLACDRLPKDAESLASQPTLSRFENASGGRELAAVGRKLERTVIERLKHDHPKARRITIDLDPTDDPTHGQQAFSFFNGYYDSWCYLPLLGFLSVDDEPEQHLFYARLRPGNAKEMRCTGTLLRRTVATLRRRFKKARILVRLDAGFACPQLFDLLEELGVDYLAAMAKNKVLSRDARHHLAAARNIAKLEKRSTQLYYETLYQAGKWSHARRVVFKTEVLVYPGRETKDNVRFVVTNLRHSPEKLWHMYCGRGDSENRIKELHHDLEIDRTSCSSFLANQFRVLQTAAAYVLYQQLRTRLRRTELGRAQVATLRNRLIKVAAVIKTSVRRVLFSFPSCYPWKELWRRAAWSLGAASG
jgi:hypothetical protein